MTSFLWPQKLQSSAPIRWESDRLKYPSYWLAWNHVVQLNPYRFIVQEAEEILIDRKTLLKFNGDRRGMSRAPESSGLPYFHLYVLYRQQKQRKKVKRNQSYGVEMFFCLSVLCTNHISKYHVFTLIYRELNNNKAEGNQNNSQWEYIK